MKRSEMIENIRYVLYKWESDVYSDREIAIAILNRIEEVGMLPPPSVRMGRYEYDQWTDLEWEPEDK